MPEIVLVDDACEPKQAVAVANKIVGQVVRFVIGYRVVSGSLNSARTEHTTGIAVDQQAQQQRRVMRVRAASSILAHQLAQVKLVYDFNHEARQVILGQPFVNRWRRKVGSVPVNGNESAHR